MAGRLAQISKVLVIDDDETDRLTIKRSLSKTNPNIIVDLAETATEGAALIRSSRYDCIFLDYLLPDMDGLDFLRNLYDAKTDILPYPVVMLTGQGSEGVIVEALRWGVHDYIVKDKISADSILIALIKGLEIFELRKNRLLDEEKLRHTQKMDAVGQLTSGVAHDFNNLLTVILGNTGLVLRKLEKAQHLELADIVKEKVVAVEAAAHKGAELVRHLMVFSRQQEPKLDVLNVNDVIRDTLALLRRTLGSDVEVREELQSDLWLTKVDKGLLENAIINLSVNARDAMQGSGVLQVATKNVSRDEIQIADMSAEVSEFVRIGLTDNGGGMSETVKSRIFEPFYTTKPPGEGTGLGLAMVYGFVRQSGGIIDVESEIGKGTTFYIYLPRANAQSE